MLQEDEGREQEIGEVDAETEPAALVEAARLFGGGYFQASDFRIATPSAPAPVLTKDRLVQYLRVCADLADIPKDGIAHVAVVPLRQVIQLLSDESSCKCGHSMSRHDTQYGCSQCTCVVVRTADPAPGIVAAAEKISRAMSAHSARLTPLCALDLPLHVLVGYCDAQRGLHENPFAPESTHAREWTQGQALAVKEGAAAASQT